MIKGIFKFFISVLLLCVIGIFVAQNTPWLKNKIIPALIAFLEKEWSSKITVDSARLNLLTGTISLKNGSIQASPTCSWSFDRASVRISFLDFLRKKKIFLYLRFHNIKAQSGYNNNKLEFVDHLVNILTTRPGIIPIKPRFVQINNASLDASINNRSINIALDGTIILKKNKNKAQESFWKGDVTLSNGTLNINHNSILKKISGSSTLFYYPKTARLYAACNHNLENNNTNFYTIAGALKNNVPQFFIKNDTETVMATIQGNFDQLLIKGVLPVKLLADTLALSGNEDTYSLVKNRENLSGNCIFDGIINPTTLNGTGKIVLNELGLPKAHCKQVIFDKVIIDHEKIIGRLVIKPHAKINLYGGISFNHSNGSGQITIANKSILDTSLLQEKKQKQTAWQINPSKALLSVKFSGNKGIHGSYSVRITNHILQTGIPLHGTFRINDKKLYIKGTKDHNSYLATINLSQSPFITDIEYKHNNKKLVNLHTKNNLDTVLQGTIHYKFIQSLLEENMKHYALGHNSIFEMNLDQRDIKKISGSLQLKQGTLYIPENHNLLKNFKTTFTLYPFQKSIHTTKTQLNFSQGTITCPQALITFDHNNMSKTIQAPIVVDNLLVNWKRNFYTIISGSLDASKTDCGPLRVVGNVILKKSLLRENIFSTKINNALTQSHNVIDEENQHIEWDIKVTNEQPITIKTPTIETRVSLDLHIKHDSKENNGKLPNIEGFINLDQGCIKLLNTKLFVRHGSINFITNQPTDPLIELSIGNRINKYHVTLQATGSLQNPNILLESSPSLKEEQILSLLLTKSENATLQTDLPAMLMQNLHKIIFGNKTVQPKALSFFERITKPLKYIQITPNFTDQTGRGGIKGIVSIDVNKQLHAQIQKDFNLQDDFAFQVEYLLSDDINIKLLKDQRGDVGSELELRFSV